MNMTIYIMINLLLLRSLTNKNYEVYIDISINAFNFQL